MIKKSQKDLWRGQQDNASPNKRIKSISNKYIQANINNTRIVKTRSKAIKKKI